MYAVVPYVSVLLIFTIFQRQLMYRPTSAANLTVVELKLDPSEFRDVQLPTSDNETLRGWLLAGQHSADNDAESANRQLVIYFPGNSLNRHERIQDLQEVASCGHDVLIFDYRGFGDSSGHPSEFALTQDAKQIWNFACGELHYSENHITIFGESLGGAVALSLWSEPSGVCPKPKAVILSSTFASMPHTVHEHYPWFPFHYLVFDRWPSLNRIKNVTVPITIFHGTEDDFVSLAQARTLSQASRNATFVEIHGSGHNDIPMTRLKAMLNNKVE
jgi:fermentation-respiration switch protein FrsA (DUF1100 family)